MNDVASKVNGVCSKIGGPDFTRSARFSVQSGLTNLSHTFRKEKSSDGPETKTIESPLSKVVNESITMTSEVTHGLLSQIVKKVIFNNEIM